MSGSKKVDTLQSSISPAALGTACAYAFDEKAMGKSNDEIYAGFLNLGLDADQSSNVIRTLASRAKQILDAHDMDPLVGGIIFICGLIITVWSYLTASEGGYYIFAWGAIIFGAIRFVRGSSKKEKYGKILRIMREEGTIIIVKNEKGSIT